MQTLTVGAMSNPSSSVRPDRAAPSSSSAREQLHVLGREEVGSQPSAISPASGVFFGPIAAM